MGTEVIALRTGLYGGRVRQEGERFEIARPEDRGSWMADAAEAGDISRVYERQSSPARAEVGPNEALAYAEAGQLTTALNIQLDALRNENAHLLARLAQTEGRLEQFTAGDRNADAPDVGKSVKAALEATDAKIKALQDSAENADVHQSEDGDAVEAQDTADERAATEDEAKEKAKANSVAETTKAAAAFTAAAAAEATDETGKDDDRPTRRRRG